MREGGHRVLVVDDEPLFCRTFAALLQSAGCTVEVAASCDEALERIGASLPFDTVVVDFEMPRRPGLELLAEMSGMAIRPGVHVVSAYVTPFEALAGTVWTKPIHVEKLVPAVASGTGARPDCAFVAFVAAVSNRSCALEIHRDAMAGTLWVGQGRILAARAHTHQERRGGLRAVLALLDSTQPCRIQVVSKADRPAAPSDELLEESLSQVMFTLKAYRARPPLHDASLER